jgi:hypothetical protein
MERASMPETSVDENGYSLLRENDISPAPQALERARVLAEPQPSPMEHRTQLTLHGAL